VNIVPPQLATSLIPPRIPKWEKVVKAANIDWRIELPKEPKGDVLTDDFAPVNVYDAYGQRYRRRP
jgi:hypothetical protein